MKTEPGDYSIADLERDGKTHWDGVRNYQARNLMRDRMKVGDLVLFYHSNANPPGVVGLAEVVSEAYPDHTSWEPDSGHFDPKSTPESPRWFMVDIAHVETFPRAVSLAELREEPELASMVLLNRSRLSVQPVDPSHFELIVRMARQV